MLLFDLDGTLIDSNGVWSRIDREFLSARGISCPADYSAAVADMTHPEAARYTRERFQLPESEEEIQKIWLDMAEEQYGSRIPLKEGAADFLAGEHALGTPMCVLTSCMQPLCDSVLSSHGIRDLFRDVITTDQVKLSKAFPDIYLLAARRCGSSPEDCVVFEDSPTAAAAAAGAGMPVVGVLDPYYAGRRPELERVCRRCIHDFSELTPGRPYF